MALINKKQIIDTIKLFVLINFFKPFKNSIFNTKNILIFNSYYNSWGQNINKDKLDLGFGLIHYSLIRNIKPKNLLCIGSGRGFIPAVMALACKDNKLGKVDFVDAGFGEEDWYGKWEKKGFWKQVDPKKYFNFFELNKYLNINIKTTESFIKEKLNKKKYDFIYIDGDHTYEGVKKDYKLIVSLLKKGSFLLFHDTVKIDNNYKVKKFIDENNFKNRINLDFSSGLTIVQI